MREQTVLRLFLPQLTFGGALVGVLGAGFFTGGGGGSLGDGGPAVGGLGLDGPILRSWCLRKSRTSGMCGKTPPWLMVTPFSSCGGREGVKGEGMRG